VKPPCHRPFKMLKIVVQDQVGWSWSLTGLTSFRAEDRQGMKFALNWILLSVEIGRWILCLERTSHSVRTCQARAPTQTPSSKEAGSQMAPTPLQIPVLDHSFLWAYAPLPPHYFVVLLAPIDHTSLRTNIFVSAQEHPMCLRVLLFPSLLSL